MSARQLEELHKETLERARHMASRLDTLAVFVNKDNPIASLTLDQVDAVFSKTRRCGLPSDVTTWGQLGNAAAIA